MLSTGIVEANKTDMAVPSCHLRSTGGETDQEQVINKKKLSCMKCNDSKILGDE